MSLVKTLARVAAGVMLAKGIGSVMRNAQNQGGQPGASRQTGGGILGDLLGSNTNGGGDRRSGSGGLGGMLGQVLGGGAAGGAGTGRRYGGPNSSGASGGLGGILDQITGGRTGTTQHGSAAGGGLGGLLGGAAAGGLGGILGSLLGGGQAPADGAPAQSQASRGSLAQKDAQGTNDASFGELFNDSLSTGSEPEVAPTPEQNAMAGLLLRAMIQAAKSDGKIDDAEKQRLLAEVGELDDAERAFIREEMAKPVNAEALARETPKGMGPQVYLMSLMAIDFDNEAEARYLNALAQALGLDQAQVNEIHGQVGVQNLYA